MITLRLTIDEINSVYKALDEYKSQEPVSPEITNIVNKIKDQAEKDISTWDGYVTNEVNSILELLLPESNSGNVGIKYERVMVTTDSGEMVPDEGKASGVSVNIVLTFEKPIELE